MPFSTWCQRLQISQLATGYGNLFYYHFFFVLSSPVQSGLTFSCTLIPPFFLSQFPLPASVLQHINEHMEEHMKIGNRARSALEILLTHKQLTFVLHAVENLDAVTRSVRLPTGMANQSIC